MFGALKHGRFRSLASLILVVNVVGELQQKRTLAASRGSLRQHGFLVFLTVPPSGAINYYFDSAIENSILSVHYQIGGFCRNLGEVC